MTIRKLRLEHVGPIKKAEIEFGDLTVLVGPQASGKSIFLQFLKLLIDSGSICDTLLHYGLDWSNPREFLEVYLGEGMGALWKPREIRLLVDGQRKLLKELTDPAQKKTRESLFYIPAQRVLTLSRGWPLPFGDYSTEEPFVVREFSDGLRRLMQSPLRRGDTLSQNRQLNVSIRDRLQQDVFAGLSLQAERRGRQKRLVLRKDDASEPLPFMVWSAGQREFVPLLLGLYWLLPPEGRREGLQWVVIEELEMGLHPRAIAVALLMVLELLSRGYRICLATHSQHVLDLVWALRILQEHDARPERLLELFDVKATKGMARMAAEVIKKTAKVYFFDRETGSVRDISSLDPGASDPVVAEWGGLSEFSSRAGDVVARVVNETE